MALLYCDPSHRNHVILRYGDQVQDLHQPKAEELLRAIVELTDQQPVEGISLVNRSDSFTLIRVLATIANALAYSCHWKLYDGDTLVTQLQPQYSKPAL